MNQEQRKFLITQVQNTFTKQKEMLRIPKRPSLNNYLVAAVLDNTIQYQDIEVLKRKIKEMVLELGPRDSFIESSHRSNRHWDNNDDREDTLNIQAGHVFVFPPAYQEAFDKYNIEREEYEKQVATLESCRDTIILKIQIGSNQVLDKLVAQVDDMADLKIINANLLITKSPQ